LKPLLFYSSLLFSLDRILHVETLVDPAFY
jgi:hypothetical protein